MAPSRQRRGGKMLLALGQPLEKEAVTSCLDKPKELTLQIRE